MTGTVVSEANVDCSVVSCVVTPSVAVNVTRELPSEVGAPEMRPVTGSMLNPGGSAFALMLAVALPMVITSKAKELPVLPVTLAPLLMTGPEEGNGLITIVSIEVVVHCALALMATSYVPTVVGLP